MDLTLNLEDPSIVASLIDHTLLKPDASAPEIDQVCEDALEHAFASVCVNPYWVTRVAAKLAGSPVRVCTVIGFPLGANLSRIKSAEAEAALDAGAQELDMVLNIGALRSSQNDIVREEIRSIAVLAHERGAILKVILETCLLENAEKITACKLASEAAADFVKTSTGFSNAGATVADVQLMRRTLGTGFGVKASGGIRSLEALREMVGAGATRIGTSSGVHIVGELRNIHLAAISGRSREPNAGY